MTTNLPKFTVSATRHQIWVQARTDTADEARAVRDLFPRSLRVNGGPLTSYADSGHSIERGWVELTVKLRADGANGGVNESGIRRYRSMRKHLERLGAHVEYRNTTTHSTYIDEFRTQLDPRQQQQRKARVNPHRTNERHGSMSTTRVTLHELADAPTDWNDFSFHKQMTCVNHPELRWTSKNPWHRSIFFVSWMIASECSCPFTDMRYVEVNDGGTDDGRTDAQTFACCESGRACTHLLARCEGGQEAHEAHVDLNGECPWCGGTR